MLRPRKKKRDEVLKIKDIRATTEGAAPIPAFYIKNRASTVEGSTSTKQAMVTIPSAMFLVRVSWDNCWDRPIVL